MPYAVEEFSCTVVGAWASAGSPFLFPGLRAMTDFGAHHVCPLQTLVAVDYRSCNLRRDGLPGCTNVDECIVKQSGVVWDSQVHARIVYPATSMQPTITEA